MINTVKINIGDYIKSDFYSPIQGFVVAFGTLGKRIPAYKIRTANGGFEYIAKGQAVLLATKEEQEKGMQNWARHE